MLSRLCIMPKIGTLARHLNTSSQMMIKQTIIINKEYEKQQKTEPIKTDSTIDKKKSTDVGQIFQNIKKKNFKVNKDTSMIEKEKLDKVVPKVHQEAYNSIINRLKDDLKMDKNLLEICKELNHLISLDSSIADVFSKESIRGPFSQKLISIVKSKNFDAEKYLVIANYLGRVDLKQFGTIEISIKSEIPKFNVEQLLDILTLLKLVKPSNRIDNEVISLIREKTDYLNNFNSIIQAIGIFKEDKFLIPALYEKFLQISDTLSTEKWIKIINLCSKTKYRNTKIIEACAYNISGQKISIELIQQCFLSCGVLSYNDEQFFKFLIKRFDDLLNEHKDQNDSNWINENKKNLFSIISSIGMLNLRDKSCLNNLCELLIKDCNDPRVLINFIITCGSLKYDPKSFDTIIKKITLNDFSKEMDMREKMFFLNYVWSLCMLKRPHPEFIKATLDESFWKDIVNNEDMKIKPFLIKLLNINLYTQLYVDSYNGPLLTENMNASNYANILKAEPNSLSNNFNSALSSYRSADKHFKLNLLTPFGIIIDALMVVNEKGIPCVITDYLNENGQLETKDDKEKKIAFKLVDFKDDISGHKLSGNLSMQLLLLEELGYTPIIITQDEFLTSTVMQRVDLIKKKLEKAARLKKDD